MKKNGYLLIELLVALLLIVIGSSIVMRSSFALMYDRSELCRSCHALSHAADAINSFKANPYIGDEPNVTEKDGYTIEILTYKAGHPKQKGKQLKDYRIIKAKVSWKTSTGKEQSHTLISGVAIDENAHARV